MENENEFLVPTKYSKLKNVTSENVEVVSFKAHKPKQSSKPEKKRMSQPQETKESEEFNIKQAKFEIIKFGMSGFDSQKQEDANKQLAIRLGAKPQKNKYVNYKLLQQEKKKEKLANKAAADFQQLGKTKIGTVSTKPKIKKVRKEQTNVLDVYGKVKLRE